MFRFLAFKLKEYINSTLLYLTLASSKGEDYQLFINELFRHEIIIVLMQLNVPNNYEI